MVRVTSLEFAPVPTAKVGAAGVAGLPSVSVKALMPPGSTAKVPLIPSPERGRSKASRPTEALPTVKVSFASYV